MHHIIFDETSNHKRLKTLKYEACEVEKGVVLHAFVFEL